MSIVRVGLAETRDYGDGWDAIFGKTGREVKQAKLTSSSKNKKKVKHPSRKKSK